MTDIQRINVRQEHVITATILSMFLLVGLAEIAFGVSYLVRRGWSVWFAALCVIAVGGSYFIMTILASVHYIRSARTPLR